MLYHDFNISGGHAYAYSNNIDTWYTQHNHPAYTLNITDVNNNTIVLKRRERPYIVMNDVGQRILYTGVVMQSSLRNDVFDDDNDNDNNDSTAEQYSFSLAQVILP